MEDWRDRCVHSARRLSLQDCINKGKGKGHPVTGHERPEGEWMHRSTLSLTSTLDGVGGQCHASAALPPGKDTRYPLYRRVGGPQGRSGQVWRDLPSPGLDPRTVQPVGVALPAELSRPLIYIYICVCVCVCVCLTENTWHPCWQRAII